MLLEIHRDGPEDDVDCVHDPEYVFGEVDDDSSHPPHEAHQ